MYRLTREVRFAINDTPDDQLSGRPTNSFGGFPSLTGFGVFLSLGVTLEGNLQPVSGYLRNIKEIDDVIRRRSIPEISEAVRTRSCSAFALPSRLMNSLRDAWPESKLVALRLSLSPFLQIESRASEHPMIRVSQKFEFCASHRLHNASLSDAENRKLFGKCNNPNGHGHNYELQVTVKGTPGTNDILIQLPEFECIVDQTIIQQFDHKNLNTEVPEFAQINPSVEAIAQVIYTKLRPKLTDNQATLAAVTVWETPKTWCEYSE